jgi:hypothetical protein
MDGARISGDPEVDAFVGLNLVSFPAWDLLVFLHKNPDEDSTLPELCTSLARPEKDLKPALQRCLENGVAEEHVSPEGVSRYRRAPDPAIRRRLSRFAELAAVREIRLEFVRHVMSRLAD